MKRSLIMIGLGVLLTPAFVLGQSECAPGRLAFPGAEGAGKYTVGGRGGEVYLVTNLNDEGEGSLRKGVQKHGARTIVFAVSGDILLNRPLDINNDSITIAGQTAPGDGICLKGYGLKIKANEVIVRHLRVRPGDLYEVEQDAVSVIGQKNVIIDHCSFSWGNDEVLSAYNNENISVQWCIISESLNESHHHKGEHGYGGIWGGNKATFHHNLLVHHTSRNPRLQGGRTLKGDEQELMEFVNNVVYNYAEKAIYAGEEGHYNIVGNYFKPGPATAKDERERFVEPYAPFGGFYVSGNVMDGSAAVTADNKLGVSESKGPVDSMLVSVPFAVSDYEVRDAREAYTAVLQKAGMGVRDALDRRLVYEVRNGVALYGRKGILDSQDEVGGWPDLQQYPALSDSDKDGMPDEWELSRGLDPKDHKDAWQYNLCSNYSNLEVYINGLSAAH